MRKTENLILNCITTNDIRGKKSIPIESALKNLRAHAMQLLALELPNRPGYSRKQRWCIARETKSARASESRMEASRAGGRCRAAAMATAGAAAAAAARREIDLEKLVALTVFCACVRIARSFATTALRNCLWGGL